MARVITCECGLEIECFHFTNTCECGADYNHAGQRLASRSQWGEETGEHWTDCLGEDYAGPGANVVNSARVRITFGEDVSEKQRRVFFAELKSKVQDLGGTISLEEYEDV